jgi:hypothetical protein
MKQVSYIPEERILPPLPRSQEPVTDSKPDEPNPISLSSVSKLSSHLRLTLPSNSVVQISSEHGNEPLGSLEPNSLNNLSSSIRLYGGTSLVTVYMRGCPGKTHNFPKNKSHVYGKALNFGYNCQNAVNSR